MNKLMQNWNTTEDFLCSLELPEKTSSYSPIGHCVFIDEIKQELNKNNYLIKNAFYKTNQKGLQLTGRYDIISDRQDFGMSISFSNSYNKTIKAQVASGISSWACLNGKIFGDISFSRKHTGSVYEELQENIIKCVSNMEKEFDKGLYIMDQLKEKEITTKIAAELTGRAFIEQDIITATQMGIIKDRLSFDENFKEMNAYCLYEHFTEAAKTCHATTQIKTLKNISDYFVNEFGILTEIPVKELEYA
jgi:hypothetical protein